MPNALAPGRDCRRDARGGGAEKGHLIRLGDGIPARGLVYDLACARRRGEASALHVGLVKHTQEDLFPGGLAVVVVDEPGLAGRPLNRIWIRDAAAFIQKQPRAQGVAVVLREISGQVGAHRAGVTLQHQPAAGQPAEESVERRMRELR